MSTPLRSYANRLSCCPLQFALTAYAIAPLPFPDDVIAFLNGMVDTITNAMPNGNFGVYPGYVECVHVSMSNLVFPVSFIPDSLRPFSHLTHCSYSPALLSLSPNGQFSI